MTSGNYSLKEITYHGMVEEIQPLRRQAKKLSKLVLLFYSTEGGGGPEVPKIV